MSNISNRQRELEDIEFLILQYSIDNDDEAEEEAMLLYIIALSTRFIERPRKDRSKTNLHFYFTEVFPHLSDAAFRSCFRTTKEGFKSLMDLIQGHNIFYNKSTNPQAHPGWQLAVALMRIGTYGKGASAVREVQYIVDLINACCVLHNMLADLGDAWLEMDVTPEETEAIDRPIHTDNALQDDDAKAIRQAVQAETLRIIYGDPLI
ncbi:hypothetical protein BGX30_006820 [Mortierella sp. GBA39]|nr:hypothetical protein BGX30_006820 [Mortierella sp. GBA39]